MQRISFCDKCPVKIKQKCIKNLNSNPIFYDFDTLEHPLIQSSARCDLLLIRDKELNLIEQKSADRFIEEDVIGSNKILTKKEQKQRDKRFDSKNIRSKIENSKKFFIEKNPEYFNSSIIFYFIFSDTLIDYKCKRPNTCVNIPLIKYRILTKIFSAFMHNPILHNGKTISFVVDACCNIKTYFPEA